MIKLVRPEIPQTAIRELKRVLKSGNLVQGKYVQRFEREIEEYLSVKNVVVVSSGTAALHLSLLALDIKPGDEIILPVFTFPATANVIELVGAVPVFIDINESDFCINSTKIRDKINPKTKAIIPVHEFGQSANMHELLEIAKEFNLKLIEDAACALGTEYNGNKVGTLGDIGCFSFHPRKAITTGEGGAIVTNNNLIAKKIRALRNHGIEQVEKKLEFNYAGLNYRMTDFQAVLGIYQIKKINSILDKRIQVAERYNAALKKIPWVKTPDKLEQRKNVYQTYHIIVDENIDRDSLIQYLKSGGIEVNIGAQALNHVNYYKNKYKLKSQQFPVASAINKSGLALPCGNHIKRKHINLICNELLKYK